MKLLIASAAAIFATAFITSSAIAAPMNGLYGDADFTYVNADHSSLSGVSTGFGYRFNRLVEVEAGYINVYGDGITANAGFLDLTGHVYFTRTGRFSLFGSVGGEYGKAKEYYSDSGFGFRAGGGMEYRFLDHWSVRAGVRYQTAVDKGVIASTGLTFAF